MDQNQTNNNPQENSGLSMLDNIIATPSNNSTQPEIPSNSASGGQSGIPQDNKGTPPPVKKIIKKKTPQDIIRIFGALFFAVAILFGSFISYIVFNPQNALFFKSFGIDPQQIKNYIQLFVNVSFGAMTIILSIVILIALFKAFVTKKEFTKKKTIATIFSIFFIVILFAEITFWIYLTSIIGAKDFLNFDGGIIIRDNDKMSSQKFQNGRDLMTNFENLIGPFTLNFDLSKDAEYYAKKISIKGYKIDFDGDKAYDKEGTNPQDKDIIYTYETKGSFTPNGYYFGTDVTGRDVQIPMRLPSNITIIGIVGIQEKKERLGGKRIIFDISDIKKLGKMDFYLENENGDFGNPDSNYNGTDSKYSPPRVFKDESLICLAIKNNSKSIDNCDKVFIVGAETKKGFSADIVINRDSLDPLSCNISLNLGNSTQTIMNYDWLIDGQIAVSNKETFEYKFEKYGKHVVTVNLTEPSGNVSTVEKELDIKKLLTLARPSLENIATNHSLLRVMDKDGSNMLLGKYNNTLQNYYVNIVDSVKLKFDSNYIKATDTSYNLVKTEWDFDEDGKYELVGNEVSYKFLEDKKYTLNVLYTLTSKTLNNDTQTVGEKIVFESIKKPITMRLDIKQDSDYAPTVVHFDGSATSVQEGTIAEFTYDFGGGKAEVRGDARQDYRYSYPGEYTIKFTATKDDGTKKSITKKILLKEQGKEVVLNTSVSSGYVDKNIDFDAVGTSGQISIYSWDFGDGTSSSEPTPIHSYSSPGDYSVKLTITFIDGIVKSGYKQIIIK